MTALKNTLEDLIAHPSKYERALGIKIPTFDQFKRNPDKYKYGPLSLLDIVENGPEQLKGVIRKIRYHVNGEELPTLEAVEQRCLDLGWRLLDLEIQPDLEQAGAGRYDVHVKFVRKRGVLVEAQG